MTTLTRLATVSGGSEARGRGWAIPAVDESAAEPARRLALRLAAEQLLERGHTVVGQGEQSAGVTPDQHLATFDHPHRRVEDQPQALREGRHRVRPPSTTTTAPVIAALSVPASHVRTAATSPGVTSRRMACCSAKVAALSSP